MSQHIYNALIDGDRVQIQMGWDKPMQWFYLVVSPFAEDGELDDPIYSNLFEEDPKSLSLEYFLGVVEDFEVQLPPEMIDAVKKDKIDNVVGRRVVYE